MGAGDFVTEFFKLCCRKESVEEVLGRGCAEEEGQGKFIYIIIII